MGHETAQAECSSCKTPMLDSVLAYEFPALITRLQRKEGMSERQAREAFSDTLKFLYLCGTSDETFVPTKTIDVVWHHFILFTAAYADFCERFFGIFIHHVPAEARGLSAEEESRFSDCSHCEGGGSGRGSDRFSSPTLERTLALAHRQFGDLSPNWK